MASSKSLNRRRVASLRFSDHTLTHTFVSSENEQKVAELTIDLQQACGGIQAAKDRLVMQRKEQQSLEKSTKQIQNLTVVELSKISELKHLEAQAAADTQRLSHQLNAVRNKFLADIAKEEALEIERQEHLARIKLHLQSLCSCEGVKDFTQA